MALRCQLGPSVDVVALCQGLMVAALSVAMCQEFSLWLLLKYTPGFGPGELPVVLVGFGLVIGLVPGVVGFGAWFILSRYLVYYCG